MECVDSFIRLAVTLPALSVVAGAVTTLSLMLPDPLMMTQAPYWQMGIAFIFLASAGLANLIAPRMRIRTWGRDGWKRGDRLSGHSGDL